MGIDEPQRLVKCIEGMNRCMGHKAREFTCQFFPWVIGCDDHAMSQVVIIMLYWRTWRDGEKRGDNAKLVCMRSTYLGHVRSWSTHGV